LIVRSRSQNGSNSNVKTTLPQNTKPNFQIFPPETEESLFKLDLSIINSSLKKIFKENLTDAQKIENFKHLANHKEPEAIFYPLRKEWRNLFCAFIACGGDVNVV